MHFNVQITLGKMFGKNNLQLLVFLHHREPLPLFLPWSLCQREPWMLLLSSLWLLQSLLLWWWQLLWSFLLWRQDFLRRTEFVSQPIGLDAANRKKRISNTINIYQSIHRLFLSPENINVPQLALILPGLKAPLLVGISQQSLVLHQGCIPMLFHKSPHHL